MRAREASRRPRCVSTKLGSGPNRIESRKSSPRLVPDHEALGSRLANCFLASFYVLAPAPSIFNLNLPVPVVWNADFRLQVYVPLFWLSHPFLALLPSSASSHIPLMSCLMSPSSPLSFYTNPPFFSHIFFQAHQPHAPSLSAVNLTKISMMKHPPPSSFYL